jgi:hypothetical protein
MTKRNKKNIKVVLRDSQTCEGVIPIIIKKCNCGEAIADAVEGSIGCHRYPDCCDNDLEFIEI